MKKIIYLVITVFISVSMYAQNQKWEVIIGPQNYMDYPNDIIELYDKGYYITAYTGSAHGNGWNIKTDANGNVLYDKTLSHNDCNLASRHVCSDSSGNIYTSGTAYVNNTSSPFVIKTDSCGEAVWCKYFPGQGDEPNGGSRDIIINRDNEIVVLAFYWSNTLETTIIYLIGLDLDGNELWKHPYASKKNYPLIENPLGYDLMEMNGEYFIAGDCYWPYPNNPNHVYLRPLFVGINSDFSEKFLLPFYSLDTVFGWVETMIPINDTVIMGVGIRKQNGGKDFSLLAFIDVDGNEIGYNQIENTQIGSDINNNYIIDISRINDTLFLAAASFGVETSSCPIGEFVIDTAANLYNYRSHPNTQKKPSMVKTYDDKYLIATSIGSPENDWDIYLYKIDQNLDPVPFDTTLHVYDSLCPHTIQSGEMDLTNCLLIVGIDDWPTPDEYYESIRWIPIKAYPNPVKDGKLTLEFENTKHHQNMELRCYDDFGRQVHSQKIYKDQQDTDLNVSSWNAGIYVAVMYSNGGARGKVKFLIAK